MLHAPSLFFSPCTLALLQISKKVNYFIMGPRCFVLVGVLDHLLFWLSLFLVKFRFLFCYAKNARDLYMSHFLGSFC